MLDQLERSLRLRDDFWEQVLSSLGIAFAALLLGSVIAWALLAALSRWARHTQTIVDDVLVKHLGQPLRLLLPLTGLTLALPLLDLGDAAHTAVRQLLVVAIILTLGWVFFRAVRVLEEVVSKRLALADLTSIEARSNYTQMQGFRNIAGFLIGLITFGLAIFSFGSVRQVGASLLASAGVAGIVIGFAAQRSIATLLAGLVTAVAQPIRINDAVVVEGEFGNVEEITLTYVVVRLWDQRRMVLPINYFLEKPFQNWSRSSTQLLATVTLQADYTLPVDALRAELERILSASPHWDAQTWNLQVTDATERGIQVRALMSAQDAGTAWNLRCEVREKLVGFMQSKYPAALPKLRTDTDRPSAGAPAQLNAPPPS